MVNVKRTLLVAAAVFVAGTARSESEIGSPAAFDATERYRHQVIEGWTVRVSDRFDTEDRQLLADVLTELERQLAAVREAVPDRAVDDLRKIEIWVEVNNTQFPCMCYHANERWLRAHGVNPEKTGHVELANARNFLSWTRHQPWMVLHELAHGYHDRFLNGGFENAAIAAALTAGKEAGRYGEVDHVNGARRPHYAATNPMEYFAEGTESYFGRNDFFPFDRGQLREYDPALLSLLEELWHVKPKERKPTTERMVGDDKESRKAQNTVDTL